jgi:hypothetical protein
MHQHQQQQQQKTPTATTTSTAAAKTTCKLLQFVNDCSDNHARTVCQHLQKNI